MRSTILLIGFQDQGNLGMGYLASTLRTQGFDVEMADYREPAERLAQRALALDPLIVGFSVIFQFYLDGFDQLARALRTAGVTSHMTAGGHFPSLCSEETLELMPDLDSVVRFEGEETLLALARALEAGEEWRDLEGIAYRRSMGASESVVLNPMRALVHDLDALPEPWRPLPPEQVLGRHALPILASRGCARTCSFCSIHMFYRAAPGKVVRVRQPRAIVNEMRQLFEESGVTIFLFQDDDFPLWGKAGRRWVDELMDELAAAHLPDDVIWKISCRAEYVEPELFGRLRDHGLYLVYMGLESGNDEGMDVLHKQITVQGNRDAIEVLKDLDVMFEYGFMLFDPSSSFASIRANLAFLREIVGDGCAAATFCRMLPYGGTPIRDLLRAEGRLRGTVKQPDYDFLDPRLNEFHRALDRGVGAWIHNEGVSLQLNWAWHELGVVQRLTPGVTGLERYRKFLTRVTRASNDELFSIVEESADAFERSSYREGERELGAALDPELVGRRARRHLGRMLPARNAFMLENQELLLESQARSRMRGPITSPQLF